MADPSVQVRAYFDNQFIKDGIATMIRYSAILFVVQLVVTTAHGATLPDTGQTLCDNGSNVLVACTNANTGDAATYPRQDGRFGPDAKAGTLTKIGGGAAGFDYSKIANNGNDLGAGVGLALGLNPTDWACTRDNNTGLTWEVKVNSAAHLRHMAWTYTWYNSDASTNGGNAGTPDTGAGVGSDNCSNNARCDTEKFIADVNAAQLCGNTGWRLPTQRELLTLVHAGAWNPAIDSTYFPNTNASRFWSGSSYVVNAQAAWFVRFDAGLTSALFKTSTYLVRLVRGGQF